MFHGLAVTGTVEGGFGFYHGIFIFIVGVDVINWVPFFVFLDFQFVVVFGVSVEQLHCPEILNSFLIFLLSVCKLPCYGIWFRGFGMIWLLRCHSQLVSGRFWAQCSEDQLWWSQCWFCHCHGTHGIGLIGLWTSSFHCFRCRISFCSIHQVGDPGVSFCLSRCFQGIWIWMVGFSAFYIISKHTLEALWVLPIFHLLICRFWMLDQILDPESGPSKRVILVFQWSLFPRSHFSGSLRNCRRISVTWHLELRYY